MTPLLKPRVQGAGHQGHYHFNIPTTFLRNFPRCIVSDVCKSFEKIEAIQDIEIADQGTTFALRLRKMVRASDGLLKTPLASFLAVTPHSMATERAVSHYNRVKRNDRSSLNHPSNNK